MSRVKRYSDERMYGIDQGFRDRAFAVFLGGILAALILGLIIGPFVMPKILPVFYSGLCG